MAPTCSLSELSLWAKAFCTETHNHVYNIIPSFKLEMNTYKAHQDQSVIIIRGYDDVLKFLIMIY